MTLGQLWSIIRGRQTNFRFLNMSLTYYPNGDPMHIVSDKSLQRSGYVYNEHGVGYPVGSQPHINWKHIDGPLLYCSDGQLHWLTWRERFRLFWGLADIHDIDFEQRR